MDLILWRHAEAQEAPPGGDDLARALTPRGEREALQMGAWLDRRLTASARVLVSPALRCEQTALALGRTYRSVPVLAPGGTVEQLLAAAQWPDAHAPVVVVGHQPSLGQALAQLLGFAQGSCPVRKGALWWLRTRERQGRVQAVVVSVQTPDLLRG